ncbi:MAG: hypothetical protein AB7H77_00595 [Bdellovibrionales bacterium]
MSLRIPGWRTAATAITIGAALYASAPSDTTPNEKSAIARYVAEQIQANQGAEFFTNEAGSFTRVAYSAAELQEFAPEVIKNIQSGAFTAVYTCTPDGKCGANRALLAPGLGQ